MENKSIHPRVDGGKTRFEKVNTSKKRSQARIDRTVAGIERHLETHPADAMSRARLTKLRSA